jgi:hypothetical protein
MWWEDFDWINLPKDGRKRCSYKHGKELSADIKWGYVVAQLVETLRYKPGGCGFDYQWGRWNVLNPWGRSMTLGSIPNLTGMIIRLSHRGEGRKGKGGRCIRLTALSPLCADCLEILETSIYLEPQRNVQAFKGMVNIKFDNFFESLSNYKLLKKDSAPWTRVLVFSFRSYSVSVQPVVHQSTSDLRVLQRTWLKYFFFYE